MAMITDPTFWYNRLLRQVTKSIQEVGEYLFPIKQLVGRKDFEVSTFKKDLFEACQQLGIALSFGRTKQGYLPIRATLPPQLV
jgi:hypothetical protein